MPHNADMMEMNDVRFSYNSREVLNGLSLTLRQGELVGLAGPNGSGKTTIIRILSGVLKPSHGQVKLLDVDISSHSRRDIAKLVAVLPQGGAVAFPFTVFQVVLMGRAPHLKPMSLEGKDDLEIAEESIRLAGLSGMENRYMRQLSGGERQRVMIARALAQKPKILLMDEPTTYLDLKHQEELFALIEDLRNKIGLTILVVSHDVTLLSLAVNRLLLIKNGVVYKSGKPDDVITESVMAEVFGTSAKILRRAENGLPPIVMPNIGETTNG